MSGRGRRPRALTVPSFAKVNLGLEVLGTREDGFHELRTLFQTVSLRDELTLREASGPSSVRCSHPEVPTDERNLALRAALELQRFAGVRDGVEIEIAKRIPVAGGLGGGSSNAASVLRALDHLWGLGLGASGLMLLARRLGADVPFFLLGGTALGLARGDEVYPLARQVRAFCVVVAPGRGISTPEVFARVDASLTPRQNSHTINPFVVRDWERRASFSLLTNDLEAAALDVAPDLSETLHRVRASLLREGASLAMLSGSGSSYFGLFEDGARARRALRALASDGHAAVVCRTVTQQQYRRIWSRSLGVVGPPGGLTR